MKSIADISKAFLAAGAMACVLASPIQAKEMPPMPGGQPKSEMLQPLPPMPGFLRGLALNEIQRDEIFTILHEQAPKVRQKMKSLHASQEVLRKLALSNRFDDAKAISLADAAAKDMAELSLLRARADQMIYALLTAEQRQQMKNMREKQHEGMHPQPPHGEPRENPGH